MPPPAPTCGYRVAVASAARMASAPAGWPFSFEGGRYGVPHTGVPVAGRQLSASGPAPTTMYPMDAMNSVTAAFACAESPTIGITLTRGLPENKATGRVRNRRLHMGAPAAVHLPSDLGRAGRASACDPAVDEVSISRVGSGNTRPSGALGSGGVYDVGDVDAFVEAHHDLDWLIAPITTSLGRYAGFADRTGACIRLLDPAPHLGTATSYFSPLYAVAG